MATTLCENLDSLKRLVMSVIGGRAILNVVSHRRRHCVSAVSCREIGEVADALAGRARDGLENERDS